MRSGICCIFGKNLKMKTTFFVAAIGILAVSCGNPSGSEKGSSDSGKTSVSDTIKAPALDTAQITGSIDAYRKQTEEASAKTEPFTLETKELREKIKQKWSKLHYYEGANGISRIRTYPYEQISKRTEEFYFMSGMLVLAIVQDQGGSEGKPGEPAEAINKMYYYNNGLPLTEVNTSSEKEYTIKSSEAEELLQEAMEYLDLYKEKKK
jgi:hypothetical protein